MSVARIAARGGVVLCAAFLLTSGCGYFNALYNAQQKFADAERAEAAGNRSGALAAYDAAIDRAAVSYQKYSKSRWADDALLLIGRAHFGRGTNNQQARPDSQAIAAFDRLLEQTEDPSVRAQAFAYLGAARARRGMINALEPLDSAAASLEPATELGAFTRVWRARARFAAGDSAGAWKDLEAVPLGSEGMRADAQVERLVRAVDARDSVHWRAAMADVTSQRGPALHTDSVLILLAASVPAWGPERVRNAIPPDAGASLGELDRLRLSLLRADLAAQAGDTATAIADAMRVAGASNTDVSANARVRVARWTLASSSDEQDLPRVRSILVPAVVVNSDAVQIIAMIRLLDVLIGRASAEPLAMFVAGEFARDELGAPHLARKLFLRVDALPVHTTWNGKALLAAMDLSRTEPDRAEVERRMTSREDLYLQITRGPGDAAAFAEAERVLRKEAAAIRAEAAAIAREGDVSITRAVTLRDSVRLVLFKDSLQKHCFAVVDSLKTRGVRGDSARAACGRVDTLRFNAVMKMDTTLLKGARRDTAVFRYLDVPAAQIAR